jgi:hypothetical protein
MIAKLSGVTVEADFATLSAVERLTEAKREKKAIEEECESLELKILTALASGTHGEPNKTLLVDAGGNQLASWNLQTRPGYTVKETSYRVLRLRKQREARIA